MELPRSLSMIAHLSDESSDITDEVIIKPDLAALLSTEVPADSEDYEEFDVDAVTESDLSFNMMNSDLTNVPAPTGEQGVDTLVDEKQTKEEEAEVQAVAQYMADRQNRPKGTITKVKANDIERGLHADTVKTPPRMAETGRLDTPPTGPRNRNGYNNTIPRSPGTWNLNHYESSSKEYKLKETYGQEGRSAYTTNDVFGHLGEKRDAMREQRKLAKGEPLSKMFDHGMRYNPMDPTKDQGFRTILIPVPKELELEMLIRAKLMSRGQIYHIQKCDTSTIESTGGTNTVKVIFVNQPDWIDDEEELAKITVIADKPAHKVSTKTWPMSEQMISDIAGGATRTIIISNPPVPGAASAQELWDSFANSHLHNSTCGYALGREILVTDSDVTDKVCFGMNSIMAVDGFLCWLQRERRLVGAPAFEWEFGLDISMTAAEVAHHEQITEMRRAARARLEADQANGASSSSDTSPVTTLSGSDDQQGASVMTNHGILKGATPSHAAYSHQTTPEGFYEGHAGALGSAMEDYMEDCAFYGKDSLYGGGANGGTETSEQSKMQKENGGSADNKTTVKRDASSNKLYSGPLSYIPRKAGGKGFTFDPTAAKFSPTDKSFRYGTFPSIQASFYPDGPSDEERGPLYRKAARLPYKEDKGPGFVYRDDTIGRPPTPGSKVQVRKMGLYQSSTGVNWADEDDEDDDFGLSDLSISSGCVPPPPTPAKGKAPVHDSDPALNARMDEGFRNGGATLPRSPRQFFSHGVALGPAPAPQNTGTQIPRPGAGEFDFVSTQRAIFDSLNRNPVFRKRALDSQMAGVPQPQRTAREQLRYGGNGTSYSPERQAQPTAAPQNIATLTPRSGAPQLNSVEAAFAFGQYHPALAGPAERTVQRTADLPRPSHPFSDASTLVIDNAPQRPSRNQPMIHLHHTSLDANSQLPHAIRQGGGFSEFNIDSCARPDLFPNTQKPVAES